MPRVAKDQGLNRGSFSAFSCPHCPRVLKNQSGLTQHVNSCHYRPTRLLTHHSVGISTANSEAGTQPPDNAARARKEVHPHLNGLPCDTNGKPLPPGTPPAPQDNHTPGDSSDWSPFASCVAFETAELLYKKIQMSEGNINSILELWAASLVKHNDEPPFRSAESLYATIDAITIGDAPWQCASVQYDGPRPETNAPVWMDCEFHVWYRNPIVVLRSMVANPDFKGKVDEAPFREFSYEGKREWRDFMSGNWSWRIADLIVKECGLKNVEGASLVPIILGSDKTTVSVGTGNTEFHPLYFSFGNAHNDLRRSHRGALLPIAFLAMPKTGNEHEKDSAFRTFRRQLFHTSLSFILSPLRPGMLSPILMRWPDGHLRRSILNLAIYIANYPEQALISSIVSGWCPVCTANPSDLDGSPACARCRELTDLLATHFGAKFLWETYGIVIDVVPFTNDFPRADVHRMICPDLLHQLVKGTFFNHIVLWITEYLVRMHGSARAAVILDDIDLRIAAAPPFPELRCFAEGRNFKQWTGDDCKALMKVYLPCLVGHLPSEIIRTLRYFMDFYYILQRKSHNEDMLPELSSALTDFHITREVFRTSGVRPTGFSLPREHSLAHHADMIPEFGSPMGYCSSITEAKHIIAVKEPWRRSNRNDPVSQMVQTNERLDKLEAAHADYTARGMLRGTAYMAALAEVARTPNQVDVEGEDDDGGPLFDPDVLADVRLAQRSLDALGAFIDFPNLHVCIRRFLFSELHPNDPRPLDDIPLEDLPLFYSPISVRASAIATFRSLSDPSGVNGMKREHIRAVPLWRGEYKRYDCVFIEHDATKPGMRGLWVARVRLFMTFKYHDTEYPCALVSWFSNVGDVPDSDTSMWIVEPDTLPCGSQFMSVVHVNTILRLAHLMPVYGDSFLPLDFHFSYMLDHFSNFFVNKYVDCHANEIAF
ncbi:hypothetical protein BOTBODRAFT_54024 [Botryobasidium botryosum FD-172 SS1]|uniref:C2H2-type domain-containing protein n=1 Tax=Botryobasidium botryosum (strain FD-172 SS1) TaxID=930990 RepID=A0A067MM14_BOTB1|nr:hypothetical protein BOTBODRAFT_54024 [Botryobasidium botryosum FD-172 SS1]